MALDLRGSLKNTRINQNYYVVIDELLSNAIDSYLVRKETNNVVSGLLVKFDIEFFNKHLFGDALDLKIVCEDNGAGLGDQETKAFATKDTSFKDDLGIVGIGKCKGTGRVQFFHYFSKLNVDSVYCSGGGYKHRTLSIDASSKEISESSFSTNDSNENDTRTTITLDNVKDDIYEKLFSGKDLKEAFSAESLRHHVLVTFLQRLVGLKEVIGEFCIQFKSCYKEDVSLKELCTKDIPNATKTIKVDIIYDNENGERHEKTETCQIAHYKLLASEYKLKSNVVALCAKSAIVKLITNRYLKTKTLENNPIDDCYHIIFIEGEFLDQHVNEQRDDFNLPNDVGHAISLFGRIISFQEIYDGIDDYVNGMLVPPEWDKDIIVKKVGNIYGVSSKMISDANIRVHYGDTEETIVQRVLKKYQENIIKDTSDIFNMKSEISQSDPNADDFREKINELAWKYTSSLKNVDMANLSQLVVRRAAILEILSMAIGTRLVIQQNNEIKRKENEKIIHNIFFPMRKDSTEVKDHDMWILNEEYHYYDYIASDQPLSKLKWDGGQALFDNDVDDKLSEILKKNYEDNAEKRPDIAIFCKEGAAIIIEFKSPGVDMEKHIGDLMEYAQLLTAKSNGKLKKFYGYLIGTDVNQNRLTGYTRFPSGKGWFNTVEVREHSSGQILGELYTEILFYNDIVDRAKTRLNIYKERLNLLD
jgi:hypothetical protein